jgi:hypothetical protein
VVVVVVRILLQRKEHGDEGFPVVHHRRPSVRHCHEPLRVVLLLLLRLVVRRRRRLHLLWLLLRVILRRLLRVILRRRLLLRLLLLLRGIVLGRDVERGHVPPLRGRMGMVGRRRRLRRRVRLDRGRWG